MNKYRLIIVCTILGVILAFGFLWIEPNKSAQAERGQMFAVSSPTPFSDEGEAARLIQTPVGSDETPPTSRPLSVQAPNVLPTQIPGETLVYFFTSDSDATATVVFLINTDSVAHVVALRGYSYNGVLGYSLNINIPATSILRLVSDSIAAAPPPSWATPAPIITNFTDFTYFASLSLPKGVKVEGYVVFNPGTGTVDPRLDQGAIPLRFSTDPASVFLPLTQNNP